MVVSGGFLAAYLCFRGPDAGATDVITNETIHNAFRKSHGVMLRQRQRLHAIMDGFLTGNYSDMESNTKELM